MVLVNLKRKGKFPGLPKSCELSSDQTIAALTDFVSHETKKSPSRLRFTVKPKEDAAPKARDTVLRSTDRLGDLVSDDDSITVYVRDLGPQISWRTVFMIEYLGPLLIHPLYYFVQYPFYGQQFEHTLVQKTVLVLVMLHFSKRELETVFVHKFSMATMPLFNLFKNCTHYWFLSGVLLAFFVYAPTSWADRSPLGRLVFGHDYFGWSPSQVGMLVASWAFAECANAAVHFNLASLRRTGSTERKIPYGFGFRHLSCPNYFFEAWSWLVVSVLAGNWSVWLFFIVGSLQMYFWAVKKHRRYLREFPDYPRNRKPFIPFLC